MLIMTALSLVLSLVSWHLIEKHFLRLKVYFNYANKRAPTMILDPNR